MTRDSVQFDAAKRSYRNAKAEGNRQEEAKWANVIGNILKNRGEYVKALKWFRIDYDVSVKYLPQKHMLATCQSLGEVYLRLEHFKDALIYQVRLLLWIFCVFAEECRDWKIRVAFSYKKYNYKMELRWSHVNSFLKGLHIRHPFSSWCWCARAVTRFFIFYFYFFVRGSIKSREMKHFEGNIPNW